MKIKTTIPLLLLNLITYAQVTTSNISGKIINENRDPLPGATITITYLPWNKIVEGRANEKGFFSVSNLSPGGPYKIKFSFEGYVPVMHDSSYLILGNNNYYYTQLTKGVVKYVK